MKQSKVITYSRYLANNRPLLHRLVLLSGLFMLTGFNSNSMAQESAAYRFGVFPHMSSARVEKNTPPWPLLSVSS